MAKQKITIITDKFYQKNRFFDEFDIVSNRDDCLRPWIELKKSLINDNISIDTLDITPISLADIVIFLNVPNENDPNYLECINKKKIIFCVITEQGYIHENNLRIDLIKTFDIVFTYQSNFVNNKNIYKLNYTFDFKRILENIKKTNYSQRKSFSNLIAGNKTLNHVDELYSKRVEIIQWFNKNQPDKLDLYGRGWNQKTYFNKFTIKYKYFGFFKSFFPDYFKCYKGAVENKNEVLTNYKFSFTLENIANHPGYITEKIFDSLFNLCVPIYLGASEITEFVDPNCFIDVRKFETLEDLYNYIINISENQFIEYQKNIFNFLIKKANDEKYEFGLPYFISTIKKQISNYLNEDK